MEYTHAAFATVALILGGLQMARRKGGRFHRLTGRAYLAAMALAALSSFFLTSMTGGFSFLHILSVWTLVTLNLASVVVALWWRWEKGVWKGERMAGPPASPDSLAD